MLRRTWGEDRAAVLVVAATWAVVRWVATGLGRLLVVAGVTSGAAVRVRPSTLLVPFALMVVMLAATWRRREAVARDAMRRVGPVALATVARLTTTATTAAVAAAAMLAARQQRCTEVAA